MMLTDIDIDGEVWYSFLVSGNGSENKVIGMDKPFISLNSGKRLLMKLWGDSGGGSISRD